ncbi:conjugal transfer protein [Clostridium sp. DSM 100503]|uniref:conjugal transfer protein n=2 Tax=Clostridium sp. DSM 100503 TaxID=2963282 RepID=UPI00214A32B5|nr:conjugal transfer protein [Clostridium sp. DSM 100503]MCR1953107.1 conjugal transfer protein [Clostridium sp. DSM 100503]
MRIKTYTNIWRIEGILYSIYDIKLPVPVTYAQIGYLVFSFLFIIIFSDIFPLSIINNKLLKHFVIPIGFAWLMSKKTFDGKKPYSFIVCYVKYFFRNKLTTKSRDIKLKNIVVDSEIAILKDRSGVKYEISS